VRGNADSSYSQACAKLLPAMRGFFSLKGQSAAAQPEI